MFGRNPLQLLLLGTLLGAISQRHVLADRFPIPEQISRDSGTSFADTAADTVQYRLPNNTRPLAYDIQLTTNIHRADFAVTGRVRIHIEVLTAQTRSITLHHRQLTIVSAQLATADNARTEIAVNAPVYSESNELLTVSLAANQSDLEIAKRYHLTIDFTSTLREDLRGFYRSSYVDDDGSVRWLAGTHFEPTNARHGFPCFDEPGLRATFKLSMTHGADYFAVSNMPVESSVLSADNQLRTTVFTETPSMPTYLNAFVVSDFKSVQNTNDVNGFVQHLFARPNAINRSALGLDTGRRIMDAFESKFNVNYTLPKMDQIAVPGFRGAMENWGLIIYGEQYLLYSAADDTFINKFGVVQTVVHEFAHQWFGNLVTNKWWTYNWLNEGFASLYENHGSHWLFPEWGVLDNVFATSQNVMIHDSTNMTRPMSRYVESPADISGNFDSIGYAKAGSVLNMFLHAFTDEKFHNGLTDYLNRHANSVATEEDLFAALQKSVIGNEAVSSDFTVANIMSSWTRQSGYPIVTVQRNYSTGEVHLKQQRYLSDPTSPISTAAWWIPYNFASASSARFNETHPNGWLAPNTVSSVLTVEGLKSSDWLLLNKRQTGYYRVQYDEQNYARLAEALISNLSVIHVASRSQVVDDLFDLARSERLGYGTVFDVVKYLEHETEYVPWASALRGLELVDRLHSGSSNFAKYQKHIIKLLTNLYTVAGLSAKPEENFYRQHVRRLAILWACRYGSDKCLTETNAELQAALAGNRNVHHDYRDVILCGGARQATEEQYGQLWVRFQRETVPSVRNQYIEALACASQPQLLRSALERSLNATDVLWTNAERFQLFSAIVKNRQGVAAALDLLADRIDDAVLHYNANNVNTAIELLASHVNDAQLRAKFDTLVTKARAVESLSEDAIIRAIGVINSNDRWIRRNQKVIDDWIDKNGATSAIVSSLLMLAAATFALTLNA